MLPPNWAMLAATLTGGSDEADEAVEEHGVEVEARGTLPVPGSRANTFSLLSLFRLRFLFLCTAK